ncbi:MAG: hypothetical protein QOC71_1717 [Thermoplasmata archaeon]|nr:hypothetical protein [Thermoplasmata archaeon]
MGMRLSAVLATLTLVALLFAGCSGDKGGDGTSTSSSSSASKTTSATGSSTSKSSTGTTSSSSTTSTGTASNSAPTGTFSSVVNGTSVTFTMNATDADGDNLTWELAFGDSSAKASGDVLPTTVTHQYALGNYTANFTVTDGKDPVSYDVALKVVGAATGGVTSQDAEAEWTAAYNTGCGTPEAYDAVPMTEGVTYAIFAVDAGTWDQPFLASFDSQAAQDHILFVDAGGAILLEMEVGLSSLGWDAAGTVPADSVTGVFFGCGGLPGEHVVYHAGPA